MSAEENKAIVHRANMLLNAGDLVAREALFAPDFVDHNPPGQGIEHIRARFARLRATFPDLRETIDDLIAEGDKVAFRSTLHGTHRGEIGGTAPTGKRVTFAGICIWRIADGKIAERWAQANLGEVLRRLGAGGEAG